MALYNENNQKDRFRTEQLILRFIREHGAITVKECASVLDVFDQEAYFELERMTRRGRLKKVFAEGKNIYFPTRTGQFR